MPLEDHPLEGLEHVYNTTYTRWNPDYECNEYLSYAGGNESMWTNDTRYFNRDCEGAGIFNKPCLVLN